MTASAAWRALAAALTAVSLPAVSGAPSDPLQLVESTPCLFEYRLWLFSFRKSETFPIPPGFTSAQCDEARRVNEEVEAVRTRTMLEAEQRSAVEERKAAAARAARARLPGPRLGMTRAQVLNGTNWGEPLRVNTTTSRRGTREQWVYGDQTYLYFDNGVLAAIQD